MWVTSITWYLNTKVYVLYMDKLYVSLHVNYHAPLNISYSMDNPGNNQHCNALGGLRNSTLCIIEKMLTIVNDPLT